MQSTEGVTPELRVGQKWRWHTLDNIIDEFVITDIRVIDGKYRIYMDGDGFYLYSCWLEYDKKQVKMTLIEDNIDRSNCKSWCGKDYIHSRDVPNCNGKGDASGVFISVKNNKAWCSAGCRLSRYPQLGEPVNIKNPYEDLKPQIGDIWLYEGKEIVITRRREVQPTGWHFKIRSANAGSGDWLWLMDSRFEKGSGGICTFVSRGNSQETVLKLCHETALAVAEGNVPPKDNCWYKIHDGKIFKSHCIFLCKCNKDHIHNEKGCITGMCACRIPGVDTALVAFVKKDKFGGLITDNERPDWLGKKECSAGRVALVTDNCDDW